MTGTVRGRTSQWNHPRQAAYSPGGHVDRTSRPSFGTSEVSSADGTRIFGRAPSGLGGGRSYRREPGWGVPSKSDRTLHADLYRYEPRPSRSLYRGTLSSAAWRRNVSGFAKNLLKSSWPEHKTCHGTTSQNAEKLAVTGSCIRARVYSRPDPFHTGAESFSAKSFMRGHIFTGSTTSRVS